MASFRKKQNGKWLAEVAKNGVCRSKTFDIKLAARVWALELEQSLDRKTSVVAGKTALNAFERYGQEVSPTKKSQLTLLSQSKCASYCENLETPLIDSHHPWRSAYGQ